MMIYINFNKYKKLLGALGVLATSAFTAVAAPVASPAPEPASALATSITDNNIKYIDVLNERTEDYKKQMRENWWLDNFVKLNEKETSDRSDYTSDNVYIKRLHDMSQMTTIEMPFNQVVRSYIKMYVEKRRGLVQTMLSLMRYYEPIFINALEKYDVPEELKYLPVIESAVNPNAISRAGAAGLWQFMPFTGKQEGLIINTLVDERRDPIRSSYAAAHYLHSLYEIYHDWSLAIAAYNCGPGNVNKALSRVSTDGKRDFWAIYPYLPAETRGYVPAFIAACYVMKYHKYHGINTPVIEKKLIRDTVHVSDRIHFDQIANVLNISKSELRTLNPQFRRDIIPGSKSKPFPITLYGRQTQAYHLFLDSIKAYEKDRYEMRDIVEPNSRPSRSYASSRSSRSSVDKDRYETVTVMKAHRVSRYENLRRIAAKYGVSTSSIKRANGLRSERVSRGQILAIPTVKLVPKKQQSAPAKDDDDDDDEEELAQETSPTATVASAAAKSYSVNPGYDDDDDDDAQPAQPTPVAKPATTTPAPASKPATAPAVGKASATVASSSSIAKSRTSATTTAPEPKSTGKYASSASSSAKSAKESKYANAKESRSTKKKKAKSKAYTVRNGESLDKIARANGVSVEALKEANPSIKKGSVIHPGDKLSIPSDSKSDYSDSYASTYKSSKSKKSDKASNSSSSKKKSSKKKKKK